MDNKNNRKNKMNLVVTWPSNTFTIEELNNLNPEFKNITLRVRLKKAVEDKQVQEVAYIHNGKGRPKILFACSPVTESHVFEARDRNATTKDGISLTVVEVNKHLKSLNEEINIGNVTYKKNDPPIEEPFSEKPTLDSVMRKYSSV